MIKIEYEARKNQRNIKERNLPFDLVEGFEWDTALVWMDDRCDYCALGHIDLRIHHLVFTAREDAVRVISLRKANKREVKKYAQD